MKPELNQRQEVAINVRRRRQTAVLSFLFLVLVYLTFESLIVKYFNAITAYANYSIILTIGLVYVFIMTRSLSFLRRITKTELLCAAYILYCIISGLANKVSLYTVITCVIIDIKYILVFFILAAIQITEKDLIKFAKLLIFIGLIQAAFGFMQFWGGEEVRALFVDTKHTELVSSALAERVAETHRVVGSILNKNFFAFYLSIIALMLVTIKFKFITPRLRNVLLFIMVFGVILAGSRTAWILIIFYVGYRSRHHIRKFMGVTIMTVISLLIFSTFSGFNTKSIEDKSTIAYRVFEIFQPEYVDIVMSFGRLAYIKTTIDVLKKSPFFGEGAGNWGNGLAYKDRYQYSELSIGEYSIPRGVMEDNNLASIAGQFGFGALIIFILILTNLYKQFNKLKKKVGSSFDRSLSLFCSMFIIFMLLTSFTSSSFASKTTSYVFWLFIGLIYSYLKHTLTLYSSGLINHSNNHNRFAKSISYKQEAGY